MSTLVLFAREKSSNFKHSTVRRGRSWRKGFLLGRLTANNPILFFLSFSLHSLFLIFLIQSLLTSPGTRNISLNGDCKISGRQRRSINGLGIRRDDGGGSGIDGDRLRASQTPRIIYENL